MSSVDDRIVNMQFNNKQFVSGAAESQKSLEGLEKTLASAGRSSGLADMGGAVEGVKAKFSALQIVGVTALANIANSAVNSAKSFLTQFSGMQSVTAGFSEYELKMQSIQTIMAGSGESMKVVNGYLQELNKYSDQTIYSFSDMTSNIGKFTNAGVDLKTSVAAIKGIANAAALSGANSNEASRAMYNFAQAISSGSVKLIDWKSIELANMGTKEFKQQLIDSAVAVGTLTKRGDEYVTQAGKTLSATKGFNDSLTDQWLSTEALTSTLERYADKTTDIGKRATSAAQDIKTFTMLTDTLKEGLASGWAMSFEHIFGNLKQATKLWTGIGNAVGGFIERTSEARNEMLKKWSRADDGGRTEMLEALGNVAKSLGSIFGAVGKAFRDVFPKGNGNVLITITNAFAALTRHLIPSEETLKAIQSIFAAVFSVLKLGLGIVGGLGIAFGKLFGALFQGASGANVGILSMIGNVADIITGFQKWLTETANLTKVLGSIGTVVGTALKPVIALITTVAEAFGNLLSGEGISGFLEPFKSLRGTASKLIADLAGTLADLLSPFDKLSGFFENLQSKFETFASKFGYVADISSDVSSGFGHLEGTIGGFSKVAEKARDASDGLAEGFDKFKGATNSAKDAVSGFVGMLAGSDAAQGAGTELAVAGGTAQDRWASVSSVMSKVGDVIKDVFSALGEAAGWVKKQFGDLFGGLDAIEWASLMNALFTGATILTIRKFAKGLEQTFENVFGVFSNMKEAFGQLTDTLKAMQNEVRSRMIMNIAIAVGILTAAIISMSFVPAKRLAKGIGALAAVLGLLAGLLFTISKMQKAEMSLVGIGFGMMMLSLGVLALAKAVEMLGKQDLMVLVKGIGALAFIIAIMVAAVNQMSGIEGKLVAAGAGILLMALAMNVLAGAIAILGNMHLETLAKGLGAMAVGMGLITASLKILSGNGKGILAAASAISIVAVSMSVMAGAVLAFGSMDITTLAKGFGAMALGLALMVGSLIILSNMAVGVLVAAQAMAVLSGAMIGLAIAVGMFGNMDPAVLAIGFIAVAAGLTILMVAAALAIKLAPGLAILTSSLLLLGAAMALAGLGMALFASGLAVLVALGVAGIAVMVAAVQAFMALLPSIAVQVASAFVAFLEVIAAAAPKIRKSMRIIIVNMIGTVRDAIPEFEALFKDLINAGANVVRDTAPGLIELGWKIIRDFIDEADRELPGIIDTGINLIIKLIDGISSRFDELADSAARAIIRFINALSAAIDNNARDLRNAGLDLAKSIINGLTGGLLDEGIAAVKSAVTELASHIPGPIKKMLGISSPSKVFHEIGRNVGRGLVGGIKDSIKEVVASVVLMANAVVSAGNNAVAAAQKKASSLQGKAYRRDANADLAEKRAKDARRSADKFAKQNPKDKAAIKKRRRAAQKLANEAERERKAADKAQKNADVAAERVENIRTFQDADRLGKAAIKDARSVELADRAQRMLARANAEAAEARRLMETSKKAGRSMLRQAQKDAQRAKALAENSRKARRDADRYYNEEITERVIRLEDDFAFEEASDSGKASILRTRAEANESKAEKAKKEAEALTAQAKAVAEKDAAKALRLVGQAEQASVAAREAADEAKRQREEAERYLNPQGGSFGSGGASSIITPNKSIIEQAAKAIDRYTASLQQAEEYATAQQGSIQFVQHNHSPEALNPSEIYRHSKNLLSSAEIKMGAISS